MSGNLSKRSSRPSSSTKQQPVVATALNQDLGLFEIKESAEFGKSIKQAIAENRQSKAVAEKPITEGGKFAYLHRRFPSEPKYDSASKVRSSASKVHPVVSPPKDETEGVLTLENTLEEEKDGVTPTPSPPKVL
jgi:hypothetical protein